jgi:hypothetical protein
VTGASRFLIGLVTYFATQDAADGGQQSGLVSGI